VITAAAARGVSVLPIIWNPPAFRSSKPAGSTQGGMWPSAKPQDMAAFARRAVWRYGPRADGGAEVVLGGLSIRATVSGAYLDRLYATGAVSAVDTLAIHAYGRSVGAMLDRVAELRGIADAHGDAAKPIRVSEYGWATARRSRHSTRSSAPSPARRLHRTSRSAPSAHRPTSRSTPTPARPARTDSDSVTSRCGSVGGRPTASKKRAGRRPAARGGRRPPRTAIYAAISRVDGCSAPSWHVAA
jgi:hypothetical protein